MNKLIIQHFPENQALVFLSHRLEILYEHLKKNLVGLPPFSKKMIIVPSLHMKKWLKLRFANDTEVGIYAGIELCFLNEGVLTLASRYFECEKPTIYSSLALSFRIADELNVLAETYTSLSHDEKKLWEPLYHYLFPQGTFLNHQSLFSLAVDLSILFGRYSIYGGESVKKWLLTPTDWQEALWGKIFSTESTTFLSFLNNLKEKPRSIELDISIHLFSFSHIPPLFFRFFQSLSQQATVCFYHLSPCLCFWSDVPSLREGKLIFRSLKKRGISQTALSHLESSYEESNTLLRNLGKVGREFAKMIEENEAVTVEDYECETKNSYTLLEALQNDMLNFRIPEKEGTLPINDEGKSIEVKAHMSPRSEIEGLYATICELLNHSNFEPKDIIVMAPDITLYLPYIKAYFGGEIPYQASDLSIQTQNRLAKGLFLLLNLEKKRWNSLALLELFSHPLFQKKHNFGKEELLLFKEWIRKSGIRWGLDIEDRNKHLQTSHCSRLMQDAKGTWENGIDQLLHQFISSDEHDFSNIKELNDFVSLLQSLKEDLKVIHNVKEASLKEWMSFFISLIETYFLRDEDTEEEEEKELYQKFEAISHLNNKKYLFSDFFPLLENYLSEEKVDIGRGFASSLSFCSMLPMRAIPAKVICLLGLNHESFPRKEQLSNLDLLRNMKEDYCPSRIDFDRYLFLEAIFSAREKIIFSYIDRSPHDGIVLPPSLLLSEVMSYIKRYYGIEKKVCSHPLSTFEKKEANKSISPLSLKPITTKREIHLTLEDLMHTLSSPLSNYIYHTLRIQCPRQSPLKEEEEFVLSPLVLSRFKEDLLTMPFENALNRAYHDPDFPLGVFANHSSELLHQEKKELERFLLINELNVSSFDKLDLSPLRIHYNDETKIYIHGTLQGVTPKGLVVNEKDNLKGVIRAWPSFLILNYIKEEDQVLFLIKENAIKKTFFKNPEIYLRKLIEYYFFTLEHPTFLFLDWIEPLLKNDVKELEKKMKSTLEHKEEWELFVRRFTPDEIISKWKNLAETLFGEIHEAWF